MTAAIVSLEQFRTKLLYHIISPEFYAGKDFPDGVSIFNTEQLTQIAAPVHGKAFCCITSAPNIDVDSEYFMSTAFVYTKDEEHGGIKGWNLFFNRRGKSEVEVRYVWTGLVNDQEMFPEAVFAVVTEVPLLATDPNCSKEYLVGTLLRPTINYLREIGEHLWEVPAANDEIIKSN